MRFKNLLKQTQGSVEYELAKRREGIDTSTDLGKIDYLKRAYGLLASLSSPVERDIYISKLSQEFDISKEAIKQEVESRRRNAKKQYEQKQWQKTVTFTDRKRDEINPEAYDNPREDQAEQGIIYFLLAHPDRCDAVCAKITAEQFVTSFNRRLFESVSQKIKNSQDISVGSFNSEFSPDEVGRIVSIIDKYEQLSVDESVCNDYIRVLKNYGEEKLQKGAADDNESFMKELERLRRKGSE